MASPKRLKPFTFFGRVPHGTTTLELAKILVKRFSKAELGGVQDFSGGKFEIFLKTRAAVQRFLEDPVVEVKGTQISFEYRGTRAKLVRIFGYSSEHHDVDLARALQPYGKILGISRESLPGMPTVWTGIRRVRMEMKTAVPNFLEVIDTTVQCEYEGVLRVCKKCNMEGHMSANCETAQCERCGEFGHEDCEAPCPKCGDDHAIKQCRKKTFASVVSGGDEESHAELWEQPLLTQLAAPQNNPITEEPEETTTSTVETAATVEEDTVSHPMTESKEESPASNAEACTNALVEAPEPSTETVPEADSDMEATSASNKRKRSPKRKNKKTPKTATSRLSDDAPITKRALLKHPATSSSSESDCDVDSHEPCNYCGSTTCDCSLVSDNDYESTSPSPPEIDNA